MERETIRYCAECGDVRYSVNGKWRGEICLACARKIHRTHTTRKCAGCEIVIDLTSIHKTRRGIVRYHSHDCYVAHRWGKPCVKPKS